MAKSKDKSFSDTWKSARPWPVLSGGKKSYPTSDIGYLPQKLKNLKIENKRASKEDLLATPKKKKRKGGPVGHRVGEQVAPNSMGGNLGSGVFGGPQMSPSIPSPPVLKKPASVKKPRTPEQQQAVNTDKINKEVAMKAAAMRQQGQQGGKPKVPGKPSAMGKPQAPVQPQGMTPRAMVRKGDTVKPQGYKRGGKVGIKDYSNVCRVANNPVA